MNSAAGHKWHTNFVTSTAARHSVLEDAQGVVVGSMLASLGVVLLAGAGLLTGGTVGVAFLIHYFAGITFGVAFFIINLPFYYLAFRRIGAAFTLKTFSAVGLTSLLSSWLPGLFSFNHIDPVAAALFGGVLVGAGVLVLFRHRASLGGFGILALYIQDRFGWKAGYVQLAFDGTVLLSSFFLATPFIIVCSVLCAIVMNITLAVNHRRDRYIAM